MNEKRPVGRPKSEADTRTERICSFYTAHDKALIERTARSLGFKSAGSLTCAILERLCIGGFSGMSFIKVGWQFANALHGKDVQGGFYFGVRPLPPLIGDQDEPSPDDLTPFIKEAANEIKKEKTV